MKRQILQLLLSVGVVAYLATGCCYPRQVAIVKKTPTLAPTGRVIVAKPAVLPPTGPILVKEYTIPARPAVVVTPAPAEVVVVVSNAPPRPPETEWFFTGIRWVRLP